MFWQYFHKWWISVWKIEILSIERVCRSAPATTSLSNIYVLEESQKNIFTLSTWYFFPFFFFFFLQKRKLIYWYKFHKVYFSQWVPRVFPLMKLLPLSAFIHSFQRNPYQEGGFLWSVFSRNTVVSHSIVRFMTNTLPHHCLRHRHAQVIGDSWQLKGDRWQLTHGLWHWTQEYFKIVFIPIF